MAELNGGLTAPAPDRGLGSTRRPRSVTRRPTPRGEKIAKSVQEQQRARAARGRPMPNGSNAGVDPGYGRPPAPARHVVAHEHRPAAGPGIGEAVNTDIGAQLSHRVSSGAIDQDQAEQVAKDRALLEQVYGPDWRVKVFGGVGRVKRLRQDMASDKPGNSKSRLDELLAKRKSFIEKAQTKVAGE